MKKFAIDYRYAGKTYSLDLYAEDFDDASQRLRAASLNGVPYEVVASIPLNKPVSILQKLRSYLP
jgi:hypothetical protein